MSESANTGDALASLIDEWERRRGLSFGETWRLDLRALVESLVASATADADARLDAAKARASAETKYLRLERNRANARLSAYSQRADSAERRCREMELNLTAGASAVPSLDGSPVTVAGVLAELRGAALSSGSPLYARRAAEHAMVLIAKLAPRSPEAQP